YWLFGPCCRMGGRGLVASIVWFRSQCLPQKVLSACFSMLVPASCFSRWDPASQRFSGAHFSVLANAGGHIQPEIGLIENSIAQLKSR
ncbi:MAG: hypothetical protein KF858_17000, partial [Candidatus Sumerlaeia bacterium]|nr:hypothetical protein [Candidatus Sumerlaeia bacterium]